MAKTFALHWLGFFDPHSPVVNIFARVELPGFVRRLEMLMAQDYFEWCAGTSVAVCDQIGWRKVFLEERVRLSFIQQQLATPLKMPN